MNITTKQDKPFWAMHFSMAVNNLLTVVRYLDKKFANDIAAENPEAVLDTGNETVAYGFADDDEIPIEAMPFFKELKRTDENANLVLQTKIVENILKHFPFLQEIKKYREAARKNNAGDTADKKRIPQKPMNPADFATLFLYYAELLIKKRNEYTHVDYRAEPLNFREKDRNLLNLERIIEFNRRTIKERFYKEGGNKDTDILLSPLTPKIVKNKASVNNPNYLCQQGFFNETKNDLSIAGLAFFVAQFLEPKYINQMIQGLNFQERDKQVLIRAFSITHIVLPRTRFETDSELSPQTIGMDVLNELHKCPDELFDMLSPENQNVFRIPNQETQDEILLKRFDKDRAATLMLRYLDVRKKFKSLRFHIYTGTFFNADYKKFRTLDGTTIEHRRLSKRIYCFDRLQDAQKKYHEERQKTEQNQDTLYWFPEIGLKPNMTEYRTDMLPKYAIEKRNEIGLTLQPKSEPSFTQRSDKYNRIMFSNPQPDCWLSLYELPVITFLAVHGKTDAVEHRISEFYDNWHKLSQAIAAGQQVKMDEVAAVYHLNFDNLPNNIKTFIKDGKVQSPIDKTKKEAQNALQKMIEKTQRQIDNFSKEQDMIYNRGGFKQGKKSKQPRFKAGNMALFIARDVVKLQKPDDNAKTVHKGKITSVNFQILQKSLALFEHRKDSLKEIFTQAGLINNPEFVEKLLTGDMVSIDRFFENYLRGKINFLKKFLNTPEECYVLRRRFARNHKKNEVGYITKWAKQREIQKDPVNLPRGLFTDIVVALLKEKFPNKELPPCTKKFGTHNATFLIQKFHEWTGDDAQWFYKVDRDANSPTLKRLARFLELKKQNKPNNIGFPADVQKRLYDLWQKNPTLTTLNLIAQEYAKNSAGGKNDKNYNVRKDYAENTTKLSHIVSSFDTIERTLRHIRLQDITLFYAMLEMLEMENLQGVQLRKIQKGKFLLNETEPDLKWQFHIPSRPLSPQEKEKNKKKKNNDQKFTLPNDLTFSLVGKMKIKNFGNFRRLINDIRLPSLLRVMKTLGIVSHDSVNNYYSADYNVIESEFDKYDRGRKTVFEVVHELERLAIQKHKLLQKNDDKQINSFQDMLRIPDAEKQVLMVYRNAFLHHEYPEFVYFPRNNESQESIEQGKARFAEEWKHLTKKISSGGSLTEHIIARAKECFQQAIYAEKRNYK
ncbi:MAG: type VI-B CRISPR-associated RNA-guided ribonuclease Cas13b [Planctomycetaceae bacterium]|jgi:hypothetical protein|nr:type VI-B CRISPR-associated RNA-guided ribonuclease Cas13b [Planctomycetaceae bacterium]